MDEILMRWAETHHCSDCDAETLFVPVPGPEGQVGFLSAWCCTACDAAVVLGAVSRAA